MVLPLPVPPLISTRARFFTRFRSNVSQSGGNIPASRNPVNPSNRRSGKRIVTAAPCATSGAITACTRIPSSLDASAIGQASSRRRPNCAHSRTAYSRTIRGVRNGIGNRHSVIPPPRSAHTLPSQVIATSVTVGSRASASNGPNSIMGHHLPPPSRWHRRLHPPPCGCSCR